MKNNIHFLLLFFCTSLFSQEISGIVKDVQGHRIPNVQITFLETEHQIQCDTNGEYRIILINGKYTVKASAAGFATAQKTLVVADKDRYLDFTLRPEREGIKPVVTNASRQLLTLNNTPASITILDEQKVIAAQIWKLSDLTGVVPDFFHTNLNVSAKYTLSSRGILHINDNYTSMATYLDGVLIYDNSTNGLPLADIERIEVLRGPQGMLYGRNALSGVINIVTKRPGNRLTASAESSISATGQARHQVTFKSPIIKDKLWCSFTGLRGVQPGFLKNNLDSTAYDTIAANGQLLGGETQQYGQAKLIWKPSKHLDLTLDAKHMQEKSPNSMLDFFQTAYVEEKSEGVYTINRLGASSRNISHASLKIRYERYKWNLESITSVQKASAGYQNLDRDSWLRDQNYESTFLKKEGDLLPQRFICQDIHFNTPANDKKLQWIGGVQVFEQNQKYGRVYTTLYEWHKPDSLYPKHSYYFQDNLHRAFSAYGSVKLRLGERIYIQPGVRWYMDKNIYTISGNTTIKDKIKSVTAPFLVIKKMKTISPGFTASFQVSEYKQIYAAYNTGFINPNYYSQSKTVSQPLSQNYELGYKGTSSEQLISYQCNLFYSTLKKQDYKTSYGKELSDYVEAYGGEFELRAKGTDNLSADLGISLTKSNITYESIYSYDGNSTTLAPVSIYYLAIQYEFPVFSSSKVFFRPEWRRIGKQFYDLSNDNAIEAISLTNIHIGFISKYLDVSFWGRNILGASYRLQTRNLYDAIPAPSGTMGVTIRAKL